MPIYEYACRSCAQHLEIAQSFKDDPLTACPACGGPLRKVYGSIGITFKGSGFYRTDSASTNGAKADTGEKAGPDKAAKTDAGGKSDASSTGSGAGGGKETPAPKAAKGANGPKAPKAPKADAASA
jgi:putative FmdB family regulatory protein